MMLLAATTKASLTYTKAAVLPSPWGSGLDFLGCHPPPVHSDHSKERATEAEPGTKARLLSALLACGCVATLAGMVRPSSTMSHIMQPVWTFVQESLQIKSPGAQIWQTCANMFGQGRLGQNSRCTLGFAPPEFRLAPHKDAPLFDSSQLGVGGKGQRGAPRLHLRLNRLIFKSQDAWRPFAIKISFHNK